MHSSLSGRVRGGTEQGVARPFVMVGQFMLQANSSVVIFYIVHTRIHYKVFFKKCIARLTTVKPM